MLLPERLVVERMIAQNERLSEITDAVIEVIIPAIKKNEISISMNVITRGGVESRHTGLDKLTSDRIAKVTTETHNGQRP